MYNDCILKAPVMLHAFHNISETFLFLFRLPIQFMWNLEGKKLLTWPECGRVQDLAVSKAGDKLVCLGGDHRIRIYDLNGTDVGIIEYNSNTKVSAIALTNDGTKLLVSNNDTCFPTHTNP